MITRENLLNNGYKEFPTNYINHPLATCVYQKCIKDDLGKKYYINAYEYDFSDIPNYPKQNKISYQFEEQFRLKDDEFIKIVYLKNEDKTLKEIEQFFENVFIKLDCVYYEIW